MVGGLGHETHVFVRLLFDIYLLGGMQPLKVPAKRNKKPWVVHFLKGSFVFENIEPPIGIPETLDLEIWRCSGAPDGADPSVLA